jgi:diguanylate cyclase
MCILASTSAVLMLLLDLVYALFLITIGVAAGWILCRVLSSAKDKKNADRAAEILARIGDLATSVATDVGAHSKNVSKISSDLTAAQSTGDPVRDQEVLETLAEILRSNEALQQQLATAEVQLQRQAQELEAQTNVARTDALTELFNRRALDDELNRRLAEWHRRHSVFTLIMVDVDHFKKFNDTHGHQAGDDVLRGVAATLRNTMREMDMVARFGGEEFAIVLPVTNLAEGLRAAERARTAISKFRLNLGDTELKVTASLGVAEVLDVDNVGTLIKRADEALYSAKKAGRDCVWYNDGEFALAAPGQQPVAKPAEPVARPEEPSAKQVEPSEPLLPTADTIPTPAPTTPNNSVAGAISTPPENAAVDFAADLRRRISECQQFKMPLTMIVVDIDDLPRLTAQWGAVVGEALLQHLSQLSETIRGDLGFANRWGTRLAIVMPGADLAASSAMAEQLRETALQSRPRLRGAEVSYTISLGVAEAVVGDSPMSLGQRAEAAVLASRASGKNCTHLHNGTACNLVEPTAGLTAPSFVAPMAAVAV